MSLFGAWQRLSRIARQAFGSSAAKKEGFFTHPRPPSPLFGSRTHVHRSYLRKFLKKEAIHTPKKVPGTGGKLTRKEILSIEKEVFPEKQYGGYITLSEFKKAIKGLQKEKWRTTSPTLRQKIRTKIKYLESLLPKKEKHVK